MSTRTWTQPWQGAIVVRGRFPDPLTWYCGIHGSTKWVRKFRQLAQLFDEVLELVERRALRQ